MSSNSKLINKQNQQNKKVVLHKFDETWTVLLQLGKPFDDGEYKIIGAAELKEDALLIAVESLVKTHNVLTDKIEGFIEGFDKSDGYIGDKFNIQSVNIPLPTHLEDEGTEKTGTTEVSLATFSEGNFYLDSGVYQIIGE